MRLISFAPHTKEKLFLKLIKKGFSKDTNNSVLDILQKSGYLNDTEYAKNWLFSRIKNKPESKKMLFFGLLKQGIERKLAEKIINEYITEETETDCAKRIIQRSVRYKELSEEELKKKLYSKGFSTSIINEVLGQKN